MLTIEILKEAFRKLLSYSYYDKTDMVLRRHVADFAASLRLISDERRVFERLLNVGLGQDEDTLNEWLGQMRMAYYPKKLKEQRDNDSHLVTNIPPSGTEVERLLIKADIPVELCILDVAWLLMYGYKADSDLDKCCWGNRMDLTANNSAVRKGNALFKKYQNQYNSWWRSGLAKANELLRNNENVSIISFDITNYYHSIDFDFEAFLTDYESRHPNDGVRNDALTEVVFHVYQRYWSLAQHCGEEAFQGLNADKHPLPLSLMSAHVFANWYLKPLDSYILETYHPLYYGRYVDDCMVVVRTQSHSEDWVAAINEELPGLLELHGENSRFAFANRLDGNNGIATLQLQQEKVYLYRFNCELPPSSLDEFEENQRERSSEYRFLTDDADSGAVNLSNVTLVDALDAVEESGRRFNILEENKYRLAVYLAKLSVRLAKYGREYKGYEEVEKIYQYFKGNLLIKHYMLWERIMTVFVLAGKKEYVRSLAEAIRVQISLMTVKDGLFVRIDDEGVRVLKESLLHNLEESELMALSLHRGNDVINRVYIDTYMVRMHYNSYPLQEFSKGFDFYGVRLAANQLLYQKNRYAYRWIPYYVKYYDIVCMLSLGNAYDPNVYDKAFALYLRLNHLPNYVNASAFCHVVNQAEGISEFNTHLSVEQDIHRDEGLTVAVVNMDLGNNEGKIQIEQFGMFDKDKAMTMQQILDRISDIGNVEIFLLPEMSLPLYELREYLLYSARHEIAFVAGLEYYVKRGSVYNYTITSLPITLYGRRDAVPVIRLKNHYAPAEKENIKKHRKKVPQNTHDYQNLYHWCDQVFTTYYCYELTSIRERSLFFSQIDAMYCPVFNLDTYYFNNIAESMARDMHCYFILANVSHLGDSRVTAPMKHDRMNLLKVKGGNTSTNKAVLLTTVLDIDGLRAFQVMTEGQQRAEQKEREKHHQETFKLTPPDYQKGEVQARRGKFVLPFEDDYEEFLAGLNRMLLEY